MNKKLGMALSVLVFFVGGVLIETPLLLNLILAPILGIDGYHFIVKYTLEKTGNDE